jgi:predicted metalloprotease
MRAPTTQQRELTADCLAGYYLGSLACRGLVTEEDVKTTLATACIIADGTGDPIADLATHGTCEQRVKSVAVGMNAYLAGDSALAACAL